MLGGAEHDGVTTDAPPLRDPAPRRILDTAARCVAERGAAELSLADVAAAAGVSKGLIHYHFQDKETLLARLVGELAEGIVARERVALAGHSPATTIDALWRWLEAELQQGTIRVLLELSLASYPAVHAAALRASVQRREAARETIDRLFQMLGLRPRLPASLLAEASVAFTDGLAIDAALRSEREPRVSFDAFWLSMLNLAE